MKKSFWIYLVVSVLLFTSWSIVRIVESYKFNIEASGHLKRAADANTVEMARDELKTTVKYLEENNITTGYTSILFKTPDADVEFWYKNLASSLDELEKINPNASQLEKTNVLMKLRETLMDSGDKSSSVTVPEGISIYPYNVTYAIWGTLSGLIMIILFGWWFYRSLKI